MEKRVEISPEVANVLRRGEWRGWLFVLPPDRLERPLYLAVDKVLEAIGGKWTRSLGGHMFSIEGKRELEAALDQGHVVDQKKTLEQFFTPSKLAERMAELADIEPGMVVLEPSAGTGRLILPALDRGAHVLAVEIDERLADGLLSSWRDQAPSGLGILTRDRADFMEWRPARSVDRVLMNPPFSVNQDIAHVRRAFEFLRPGGKLVAIMSPHFTYAEDKASRSFRELIGYPERQPGPAGLSVVGRLGCGAVVADASVELLPAGTFKEAGTNIAAVLVTIEKGR